MNKLNICDIEDSIEKGLELTKLYAMGFLFIQTNNSVLLSEKIRNIISEKYSYTLEEQNIFSNQNVNPLDPLLKIIESRIKNSNYSIGEILEKSDVYYFQRDIFIGYFSGKTTLRYEKLEFVEFAFEKQEMYESISNLLDYVSKDKLLIIHINNFHNASIGLIEFLKYYIKRKNFGKIYFIFSYNLHQLNIDNFREKIFKDTFDFIGSNSVICKIHFDEEEVFEKTDFIIDTPEKAHKAIEIANDCINFFLLNEATIILEKVDEELKSKTIKVDQQHYIMFLKKMGELHKYSGKYDEAIVFYNILSNYALYINNFDLLSAAYMFIAELYHIKENTDAAFDFIKRAWKLSTQIKNKRTLFNIKFIFYMIMKNKYNCYEELFALHDELFSMAKELKRYNSMILLYYKLYEEPFEQSAYKKEIENCNQSISLCIKYKNTAKLAIVYHNKGILLSLMGENKRAVAYYKKSVKILLEKGYGNSNEIIRAYNGMGYGYLLNGNIDNAMDYFKKAIEILALVKNKIEIVLTIYNIAYALFIGQLFKQCSIVLEKLVKVIDEEKILGIPYHSFFGLYSLLGISYIKSGKVLKAYEYYDKIKIMDVSIKNEEVFFFSLFNGLILKEKGKYLQAYEQFKLAAEKLKNPSIKYLTSFFICEYDIFLKENKQDGLFVIEQSDKEIILQEKTENFQYDVIFESINENKEIFAVIDDAISIINNETAVSKFHKKIDELTFINNLQRIISLSTFASKEFIKNIVNLIRSVMAFDEIFIYRKTEKWDQILTSKHHNGDFTMSDMFIKLFESGEAVLAEEKDFENYKRPYEKKICSGLIIPIQVENKKPFGGIVLLSKNRTNIYTDEELRIATLAAKQVSISIYSRMLEIALRSKNKELKNKNIELKCVLEKMETLARTDNLTGLSNRHDIIENIEIETAAANRSDTTYSLIMMDVDYFKKINDTFGHDCGDFLLTALSGTIRDTMRLTDKLGRWGGEEFLLLLPKTSTEGAKIIAERLREKIENESYNFNGNDLKITVTLGVSEYIKNDNYENTIKSADNALYSGKKSGRNKVVLG